MGTKRNPGRFDCYANAEPDEPMFVLLGRDQDAPICVRLWAAIRRKCGEKSDQVAEAEACAVAMVNWRKSRPSVTRPHVTTEGMLPIWQEKAQDLRRRIGLVVSLHERRHVDGRDEEWHAMMRTLREWEAIATEIGWPEDANG